MAELVQNYELSIWEDYVDANKSTSETTHLQERKVAVIANSNFSSNISAYQLQLTENINGERTLTFNLPRRYRNEKGELVDNPFLALLSVERKIKLRDGDAYSPTFEDGLYTGNLQTEEDTDERWIDFVIKSINENENTEINTYTCKEIFVNELGKNGWSVILDTELENNYGTVTELADRVLEGSGWTVAGNWNPTELVDEQLFICQLQENDGITAKHTINGAQETATTLTGYVYFFYSQVEVNSGAATTGNTWKVKDDIDDVQVLWKNGELFTIDDADDNRVIIDDSENFVYSYDLTAESISKIKNKNLYVTGGVDSNSVALQGGRIVKSVSSHFEPVMDKYVYDYEVVNSAAGDVQVGEKVYSYYETEYATPDLVQNYLANSSSFTTAVGWQSLDLSTAIETKISFHTMPLEQPSSGEWLPTNYLVLPKDGGTILNQGPSNQHFYLQKDKVYVIRVKLRRIDVTSNIYNAGSITTSTSNIPLKVSLGTINVSSEGNTFTPLIQNNWATISGFTCNTSTDNYYENYGYPKGTSNVLVPYSSSLLNTICYDNDTNSLYVYVKATKTTKAFGEDVYFALQYDAFNSNYLWHIANIELFDYYEVADAQHNNRPLFPEVTPKVEIINNQYFYKIENNEVVRLSSDTSYYEPIIRDNFAAVRHIDIKESNYFNIINSIAELFEIWVKFIVKHNKDGSLYLDENNKPVKQVKFSRFNPNDEVNYTGFRYGVNLNGIQRTIDSTQIATKLIIKDNNNEFATDGMCSIRRANDNPSGENTIYDFSYYINSGMLDETQLLADLYGFSPNDLGYYYKMREINNEYLPKSEQMVSVQGEIDYAKEMIEYCETSMESAQDELQWQQNLLNDYQSMGIANNTINIKKTTIAQLKAQLITFEDGKATYEAQLQAYEDMLDGGNYTYKGVWTNTSYLENDIVIYEENPYRAISDISSSSTPPTSDTTHWSLLSDYTQMNLVDQTDYLLDRKQYIESQLFARYSRFIQEGTWTDDQYIDDNLYYLDGLKVSSQNAFPKTSYQISVVDIEGVDKFALYNFKIGQTSYIIDPNFFGNTIVNINGSSVITPFKKEVIVSERRRVLDNPSQTTLTIQTYKNQFEELFSKLTSTTQSLQYASGGYDRAASTIKPTGEIEVTSIEQAMQNNAFILANSKNQSVTWDSGMGIVVSDLGNSSNMVRITSNGIMMTTDGGRTWINGLTGNGINTRYLTAGQIDASLINIVGNGNSPLFTWNEDGISAFMANANTVNPSFQNGEAYVRFNEYGIFGTTQGTQLEEALDALDNPDIDTILDTINQYSNFALSWYGMSLMFQDNSVSVTATGGLQIFGPYQFEENTITHYPYIIDPNNESYVVGDKIPLVSLGKFYNLAGDAHYGLRLRNTKGYITLTSDDDGNLWLQNSLHVGSNGKVSISDEVSEIVYINNTTDEDGTVKLFFEINTPYLSNAENDTIFIDIPVGDNEIVEDHRASTYSTTGSITISGNKTQLTLDSSNFYVTIYNEETQSNETLNVVPGYYTVTYKISQEVIKYFGINGSTEEDFNDLIVDDEQTGVTVTQAENPIVAYAGYAHQGTLNSGNYDSNVYYENAPFKLYADGTLSATKANITGIINAQSGNFLGHITVGTGSGIDGSNNALFAFWAGNSLPTINNLPPFYVTPNGELYAQNATIYGSIYAEEGSFSGTINANDGYINRLYFNDTSSYIGANKGTIDNPVILTLTLSSNITGTTTDNITYNFDISEAIPEDEQSLWQLATQVVINNETYSFDYPIITMDNGEDTLVTNTVISTQIQTVNDDLFININNSAFGVNKIGEIFGDSLMLDKNTEWDSYVKSIVTDEENFQMPTDIIYNDNETNTTYISVVGVDPIIGQKVIVVNNNLQTVYTVSRIIQPGQTDPDTETIYPYGLVQYTTIEIDEAIADVSGVADLWRHYNILIGKSTNGAVLSIYNPNTIYPQHEAVFEILQNGSISMQGNLQTVGDLILSGRIVNNNLIIDGTNGYISGGLDNGPSNWRINGTGDALFNNVEIRGKISSVVYEYGKTSSVGGKLLISPSFALEEELTATNHVFDITNVINNLGQQQAALWETIDEIHVNVVINGITNTYETIITSENGTHTFTLQDILGNYVDVLPIGTQIISHSTNSNSILMDAENENGAYIRVRGPKDESGNYNITIMGHINLDDLPQQLKNDFNFDSNTNINGLIANNAYITGKVYLPQAGITNENIAINANWQGWNIRGENDPVTEDDYIRIWAGASAANMDNANFIVTQDGSLYAQDGIFNGTVNATNSEFQGYIRATGVLLDNTTSAPNSNTDYSHFFFQWDDELNSEKTNIPAHYVVDINKYGLNIWNSRLTIFSSLDTTTNSPYYWDEETLTNIYWPETEKPWPVMTFIDDANNPRITMNELQIWKIDKENNITSNNSDYYGVDINYKNIVFSRADGWNNTTNNNYDNFSNILLNNNTDLIKIGTIGNVTGIAANQIDFTDINGNNSVMTIESNDTNSKATLHNLLFFSDIMQVEQVSDGLVFTYIGQD